MKCSAIIVAGGEGARMGRPKQFIEIAGKPMCVMTCSVFESLPKISEIIMVVAPDYIDAARELMKKCWYEKVKAVVPGGRTRQVSVQNGLREVSADSDCVLIHDSARPLVTPEIVERVIAALNNCDAVIPVVPVTDTIKEVSASSEVVRTLDRANLRAVQTPQGFKVSLIRKAAESAAAEGFNGTDDAALVERMGHVVVVVPGSCDNIKVTTPFDLLLAESIIADRSKGAGAKSGGIK